MMHPSNGLTGVIRFFGTLLWVPLAGASLCGGESTVSLQEARAQGRARSLVLSGTTDTSKPHNPEPALAAFRNHVEPVFKKNCVACHDGPGAREEVRTTHPERWRCRQCHVPVGTRDEFESGLGAGMTNLE